MRSHKKVIFLRISKLLKMTFCLIWILSADLRSSISRSLNDFAGKVTEEARTADEINKLLAADARARALVQE